MARSVPWRRVCPDGVSWHQDEAMNTVIYILRETGPTGFLLKEEGESKKFKVYLGDPHSCTCQTFKKERDLCKHICWVLLKKFRVPRQNPVTWQHGLVEREISEILRGIAAHMGVKPSARSRQLAKMVGDSGEEPDGDTGTEAGGVGQRPISKDDVCPICQEELLAKHMPVTYCKFGCGNSVHIKCMKVWADHQKSTGDKTIKCPFCREDFGPFSLLQQEFRTAKGVGTSTHMGVICKRCHCSPITGKCYKCTMCAEYHLCQTCFNTPVHNEHSFHYREKPSQRWRPAQRSRGVSLPDAVAASLQGRELSEQDYDLLLQLDRSSGGELSDLTEETVRSLPLERVRTRCALLAPGEQCRICLQRYQEGQFVRRLPCRHNFHRDCIDNWLLHQHPTCPVDGTTFSNDSIREMNEAEKLRRQNLRQQGQSGPNEANGVAVGSLGLEIRAPGQELMPLVGHRISAAPADNPLPRTRPGRPPRRTRVQRSSEPDITVSGQRYEATADQEEDPILTVYSSNQPILHSPSPMESPVFQSPTRGHSSVTFSPNVLLNRTQVTHDVSNSPPTSQRRRGSLQENSRTDDHVTHEEFMRDIGEASVSVTQVLNAAAALVEQTGYRQAGSAPGGMLRQPPSVEPAAPSIPHRHAVDLALNMTGHGHGHDSAPNSASSTTRKPPSGPHNIAGSNSNKKSRGRGRAPLPGHHARSTSRDRSTDSHSDRNLYIGHDPSTAAGFTSHYVTSPSTKPRRPSRPSNTFTHDSSEPHLRWGATRRYSGQDNEITLAGSALSNVALNDT